MTERNSKAVRAAYFRALFQGLALTWPVLSGLVLFQAVVGVVVGLLEGWGIWKGIYFADVTGLTIGYGDRVPRQVLTQILAILLGLSGIVLTGLVAALAVRALQSLQRPATSNGQAVS